ncbi:MAG: hypothetical protein ILM98_00625 [Kiritimatiellae bacterium]|nr:hypothetical protein [Kiritimatiellia bacterium]
MNFSSAQSIQFQRVGSSKMFVETFFWNRSFCGKYSRRYRAEVGKLVRRLAARVNGPDVVALMQAPCAHIHAVWLRHGASRLGNRLWRVGMFLEAYAQQPFNFSTFQLFNLSTFQLFNFYS